MMNLNHTYGKNEDSSVVVSFTMEHAIVKAMVVALKVEKNKNIPRLLAEPMLDPIKGEDGCEEKSHCKKL